MITISYQEHLIDCNLDWIFVEINNGFFSLLILEILVSSILNSNPVLLVVNNFSVDDK